MDKRLPFLRRANRAATAAIRCSGVAILAIQYAAACGMRVNPWLVQTNALKGHQHHGTCWWLNGMT